MLTNFGGGKRYPPASPVERMMLFEKPMIVPAAPKRLASAAIDVDDDDDEYDNSADIQDTDLIIEADDIRYLIFGEVSTEDDSEED